jgi:outer membrane protein
MTSTLRALLCVALVSFAVRATAQVPATGSDDFAKRLRELSAQPSNPKSLTLQEAVDLALANNLTIRRQELTLDQAGLDKQQADWAWWSPTVNAGVGLNRSFGTTFDQIIFQPVFAATSTSSPFLQANWNVFQGLGRYYTRKQTLLNLAAANKGLERTKNTVVSNVVLAYMAVILDLTNINISRTRIQLLKGQKDRVERLYKAGAGVQFDVLNTQSQIAVEEINLTNNINLLRRDKITLLQLAFVQPGDSLDGGYDFVPVDTALLRATPEFLRAPNLKELESFALENMPEMEESTKRLLASGYAYKSTWGGYLPTLSVSGNLNSFYTSNARSTPFTPRVDYFGQIDQNFQQAVGINLNIPIHNQLQRRRQVEAAKINKSLAQLDYETTRNDLILRVRQAYLDFVAAKTNLESITTQQVALNEAYSAAEKQYSAGLINFVQYYESLNNRSRVESQRVQAVYTLYFRRKILDFFGGKPLTFETK